MSLHKHDASSVIEELRDDCDSFVKPDDQINASPAVPKGTDLPDFRETRR